MGVEAGKIAAMSAVWAGKWSCEVSTGAGGRARGGGDSMYTEAAERSVKRGGGARVIMMRKGNLRQWMNGQ